MLLLLLWMLIGQHTSFGIDVIHKWCHGLRRDGYQGFCDKSTECLVLKVWQWGIGVSYSPLVCGCYNRCFYSCQFNHSLFLFTDVKKPKKKTRGIYSSILAQKVAVEIEARANLAPPRNFGTILVDLTPRQFSAPVRESKTEEEERWTKKRYEILKKSILVTIHQMFKQL